MFRKSLSIAKEAPSKPNAESFATRACKEATANG